VALIEFSDFQCPYCGKFAREILPELEKQYVSGGQVVMAFRQLPLPNHQFAQKAAEAAECAGRQDRFWPMHDAMFQDQKQIDEAGLRQSAQRLGLDPRRFSDCLIGETSERVKRDANEAKSLRVSGTPTFLFGYVQADGRVKVVKRFSGAQPVAQFRAALDPLLAAAGSSGTK
jgi:protein-disulfide isomerase